MAELTKQDVFGGGSPLDKLLEELTDMYPPYTPTPKDGIQMIMYRAGQQSVIEYIQEKQTN
jgi:hypothetical protein